MTKLITRLRKSKKGFTLVELLVVIAIIGVLMAILIPTVTNFIGDARKTAADSGANNIYNVATAYQSKLIGDNLKPITVSATLVTALQDDKYLDAADYTSVTFEFDETSTVGAIKKVVVVYGNGTTGEYPRTARPTVPTSEPD